LENYFYKKYFRISEDAHKSGHFSGSPSKKKSLGHSSDAEAFQMPDGAAAKPGGAYLSLSIG
jgi:hypothetical protein